MDFTSDESSERREAGETTRGVRDVDSIEEQTRDFYRLVSIRIASYRRVDTFSLTFSLDTYGRGEVGRRNPVAERRTRGRAVESNEVTANNDADVVGG